MKIQYEAKWSKTPTESSVEDLSETSFGQDPLGALEDATCRIEHLSSCFGRLLDLLAKKQVITAPEVCDILDIYIQDARFIAED